MGASSYLTRLFQRRHKDSCTSNTSLRPRFPSRNEAYAGESLKLAGKSKDKQYFSGILGVFLFVTNLGGRLSSVF